MSHGGDQQTTKEVSTEMFHVTSNACPQSTGISSLEKKKIKDSKFENILLYLQKDSISLQITVSLKMMNAFKLFSAALRRSQEIWGRGEGIRIFSLFIRLPDSLVRFEVSVYNAVVVKVL